MLPTFSLPALILLVAVCKCQLKQERLRIVDSNEEGRNYFVRGNLPIDANRQFQYEDLKSNLTALTGLDQFSLKVISFLNFLTAKETKNRYIEEKYFEKYP